MRVEILYVHGCPHYGKALTRLRQVLQEQRVEAEITELEISNRDAAEATGFLGSPSIRIDGQDIERGSRPAGSFGLSCRIYAGASGSDGAPPRELIRDAVLRAKQV